MALRGMVTCVVQVCSLCVQIEAAVNLNNTAQADAARTPVTPYTFGVLIPVCSETFHCC